MSHMSSVFVLFVVFAVTAICAIGMVLSMHPADAEEQIQAPGADEKDVKKPA